MTFDSLDREILATIDLVPRTGSKAIAERVGRSPQVIEYRLKSLEKRGIVGGFYPIVDAFKLGFRYCRLFVKLADFTPKVVRSITTFVRKTPSVLWCYRMHGDHNIVVVFWTRSLREFDALSLQFLTLPGLQSVTFNQNQVFQLDQYHVSRALKGNIRDKVTIQETEETASVDSLDQLILSSLGGNARQPYSRIAHSCGTSDKVVAYRIQRMEESGILCGFRPIINWSALGRFFFKILLQLDSSRAGLREKVLNYVTTTPELLYVIHGVGNPGDIDIEIVVPTYEALFEYVEKVRTRFPSAVRSFSHYHFTDCYKVNYFPLNQQNRAGKRGKTYP
jgi:Lrp/AsnC family leucine-responsive transcriptional regulator